MLLARNFDCLAAITRVTARMIRNKRMMNFDPRKRGLLKILISFFISSCTKDVNKLRAGFLFIQVAHDE
jgi:hypothetical protein